MSTTNSQNVLISYDINKKHSDVKAMLEGSGWMTVWKHPARGSDYTLPNTTLWKKNISTSSAIIELQKVCASLVVTLEKAVAVDAKDFEGI